MAYMQTGGCFYIDGCQHEEVCRPRGDCAAFGEPRTPIEDEMRRLRRALEDAAGKAELGAKMVSDPRVAEGFRVIARHCRDALA